MADLKAADTFLTRLLLDDFMDLVRSQAELSRTREEYEVHVPVWRAYATERVDFISKARKLSDDARRAAADELARFLVEIQAVTEARFV